MILCVHKRAQSAPARAARTTGSLDRWSVRIWCLRPSSAEKRERERENEWESVVIYYLENRIISSRLRPVCTLSVAIVFRSRAEERDRQHLVVFAEKRRGGRERLSIRQRVLVCNLRSVLINSATPRCCRLVV